MTEAEKRERNELIQMSKDSFNLFKLALNEQTNRIEKGAGTYISTQDMSQVDASASASYLGPPQMNPLSSARVRGAGDQTRNET